MEDTVKTTTQCECPICKSDDLEYNDMLFAGDGVQLFYKFTCNDCGAEGKEWYKLEFTEMVLNDNN